MAILRTGDDGRRARSVLLEAEDERQRLRREGWTFES
jgi:hypothetical protein